MNKSRKPAIIPSCYQFVPSCNCILFVRVGNVDCSDCSIFVLGVGVRCSGDLNVCSRLLPKPGNLHPLLNGESLKEMPDGQFENRMSQIWSIFKQMFENTVHFQTYFEKIPLAPPPAAPPGRCRALGRGIFQNLFENGPYFQTSV